MSTNLPTPTLDELNFQRGLLQHIHQVMVSHGMAINFARFMELVLYAPGLGYYTAGARKFGREGDYVTAVEITPLFARCLARQCQQILASFDPNIREILEIGAGTGRLAVELLLELEKLGSLPHAYKILEISAELRERQQQLLQNHAPHLLDRVQWLQDWPATPITGVVVANEVLDAFPVHRFCLEGEHIYEYYVESENDNFIWQLNQGCDPALYTAVTEKIIPGLKQQGWNGSAYSSELSTFIPRWLATLNTCIKQGVILLIDYGFPRHEYYHLNRASGTLMCHYRHRAHDDPLILAGLQDITAHVDFTLVAETAVQNNLEIAGFTTQAAFLLDCGLLELVPVVSATNMAHAIQVSQQLQMLLMPQEMGELFKVIALTKHWSGDTLMGFRTSDQRQRL